MRKRVDLTHGYVVTILAPDEGKCGDEPGWQFLIEGTSDPRDVMEGLGFSTRSRGKNPLADVVLFMLVREQLYKMINRSILNAYIKEIEDAIYELYAEYYASQPEPRP